MKKSNELYVKCPDGEYAELPMELQKKMEIYEERINKVIKSIEHELYGHILSNDEETWNSEFYTKGKLDYRKLLIAFMEDYLKILKGE